MISKIVEQQVKKRIDIQINKAGFKSLKNISDKFETFSLLSNESIETSDIEMNNEQVNSINIKPKLAILPFVNSNNDEDSGFLVDGIVEDLITEFSMMREFEIISRQASLNYKEQGQILKTFINKFSLDFIISGSIRASGKRIRINIELSDAKDESILWSNKYDRVMEDIFDVQDEIVRKISIALLGEIEVSSLQRSKRKPSENINSYEYLLRGKEQHHLFSKDANKAALDFFDKAILADKNNAQAYAWKVCTLGQGLMRGFIDEDPNKIMEIAEANIKKAFENNENDFECHRMLSAVYLSRHDYSLAEDHGRKSYQMVPNDPRVLSGYGEVLVRVDKTEEGLKLLHKAFDLDPVPQGQSNSDNRIKDLILGYFFAEDFKKVIEFSFQLRVVDQRSLALILYSRSKLNEDLKPSNEFKILKDKFNELDWESFIDRFHIPDQSVQNELVKFMKSLN